MGRYRNSVATPYIDEQREESRTLISAFRSRLLLIWAALIDTKPKENESVITKLYQQAAEANKAEAGNANSETVKDEDVIIEEEKK